MHTSYEIEYLPYQNAQSVDEADLLVVDCHYPRGLALTHLYSDRVPVRLRANTSTETVLNWLALPDDEKSELGYHPKFVTANHWDIDGFLAMWSTIYPRIAEHHRNTLISAAHLGDFREFDPNTTVGLRGLKICSLLNHVERSTFCLPFGDLTDATMEYQVAERKFGYFLPRFAQWLERIDDYRLMWEDEFTEVLRDIAEINSGEVTIEERQQLDLSIIRSKHPLHYYAGFNRAKGGLVITSIDTIPYIEVEYKYETSVGRLDRMHIERVDLSELAAELTLLEQAPDVHWVFDNILEGGPMLRPEYRRAPLSHEERYQSMVHRLDRCPATSLRVEDIALRIAALIERRNPVTVR